MVTHPDLRQYPEFRGLIDRRGGPVGLAALLYGTGITLHYMTSALHTDGAQMLVWGFFV